jgi:dihydrodipicolinate synthase/N-acetylneuraminate lyase
MKIQKYEGLVAAPFTPMDKDGNINYDMIKPYYDFLEKNGVVGAFINGSTGERETASGGKLGWMPQVGRESPSY